MSAPNTRWTTAEELAAFPAPLRYELLRGKLRKMAPAGDAHGAYTMDLATELNYFIRLHDLGRGYAAETGFREIARLTRRLRGDAAPIRP